MSKRLSSKFAAQADSTKDGLHHNLSFQPLFDLKVKPATSAQLLNLTACRDASDPLVNARPKSLGVWSIVLWVSSCGCYLPTSSFGLHWVW